MAKTKKDRREDRIVVPTSGGLKEKNYKSRGDDGRTRIKEGETVPLMFGGYPTKKTMFKEYDSHQWREGKNSFRNVPCIGEDLCPLCDDDDDDISKTRYQFITPVYNLKTKKYEMLRGGRNMAGKIGLRFKRLKKAGKEKSWLSKAWDITAIPAAFTDYDVDRSDKRPVDIDESKMIDVEEWLFEQVKNHYGDDIPTASSLDDDEDDEDEDDDDEEEEKPKKRKKKKSRR